MKMWLNDEEIEELAHEITVRNDFEVTVFQMMDKIIWRIQSTLDVHDRSEMVKDILSSWALILQERKGITDSVALRFDENKEEFSLFATGQVSQNLWTSFDPEVREKIKQAVLGRYWLSYPLENKLLLVAPCAGSDPPVALIVTAGESTSLVMGIVSAAAVYLGFILSMLRLQEILEILQRERGHREMAARIAHMSSGSILLAHLRLSKVAKKEDATVQELRYEIEGALNHLEETRQGLDRARLLGVPWKQYRKDIPLGEFVADIASDLNKAIGQEVVKNDDLSKCKAVPEIIVSAAPVRLRYALRDFMLGTWILSELSEPDSLREPIHLSLAHLSLGNGDIKAQLRLIGSKISPTLGVSSGQELENRLRDPEVFLVSPDKYLPERSIGFHLAWALIEEIDGSEIHPYLVDGRLGFIVELPLT
jgi:hypothetical protein